MEDGSTFIFYHEQDCCESVYIEDVIGDLDRLIGHPLVAAELVSSEYGTTDWGDEEWSFYKFQGTIDSVTVRWYGESNGYYSVAVSYCEKLSDKVRCQYCQAWIEAQTICTQCGGS